MKTISLFASFIQKPQNINFDGEDADEHILYVVRKSFYTNLEWLALAVLLIFSPTIINFMFVALDTTTPNFIPEKFIFAVNLFIYLLIFGFCFERFLNWFFNIYIITDKRVVDMDFHHLLYRDVSEAPLRNIEDVTYKTQGFMGTIFNFGTVSIQTAGERRELEFENVANPSRVSDLLTDLVRDYRGNS